MAKLMAALALVSALDGQSWMWRQAMIADIPITVTALWSTGPVPGVRIDMNGQTAFTNGAGDVTIILPPKGTFDLVVTSSQCVRVYTWTQRNSAPQHLFVNPYECQ